MSFVTLVSTELPDLLPMANRSPGLHQSEIIADLCRVMGYFDPSGRDNLSTTWAQCGQAWEDALISRLQRAHPDRYVRPAEAEHDGIFVTPDAYDCWDAEPVEIKLSWLNPRDDPDDEKLWRYRVQLMGYATAMGCGSGRLSVTFVKGGRGDGPVARMWRYQWTRGELAENWRMLRTHGDRMLREGYIPEGQREERT